MPSLADIEEILLEANNPKLKSSDRQKLLAYAKHKTEEYERISRQNNFGEFVRFMWPDMIPNWHFDEIISVCEKVERTPNARQVINIMPRVGKSEIVSGLFVAWYIGRNPSHKILHLCLKDDLVQEFGRRVRDYVENDRFLEVFPDLKLHPSSRAVDSFATTVAGSKYLAAGVGTSIHGFGADLAVLDDVVSEQDALSAGAMEKKYLWYEKGPRNRLQPNGRVLCNMSRWAQRDFCGILAERELAGIGEKWDWLIIPAYSLSDQGERVYMWPEYWPEKFMREKERTTDKALWAAQFMQDPISEDRSAIPIERWKQWRHQQDGTEILPHFSFKIQAWDTAYTTQTKNSASACTTWGIFYLPDRAIDQYGEGVLVGEVAQIMLLDAYKGYIEFPKLKSIALNIYNAWTPDEVWIEGRASGKPLLQEMKKMLGGAMKDYTPVSGETKEVRLAAVSDFWASGRVWTRELDRHPHLNEVVLQCSRGPSSVDSDLVDSTSMALRRFRKGGFVTMHLDDSFSYEKKPRRKIRRAAVYG